jgi:hypothetical protein
MMTAHTITFPGQWIAADQFEQALHQTSTHSFFQSTGVRFRFLPSCKMMVDAAVRLLSLANQLADEGVPVTMQFEDEQNGVMSYLNRANFFTLLSPQICVLPGRPDSSLAKRYYGYSKSLVEFEPVNPAYNEQIKDIPTKLVDALTTAIEGQSETFGNAMFTIFTELINNIYDHSQTILDGFAALQVYARGNRVQVVVSDSGVGLLETLRPKLLTQASKDLPDAELVRYLFRDELEWENAGKGQGLHTCARKALRYNGSADIRLATCRIQLQPSQGTYDSATMSYQSNLTPIKGTHVCFSFGLPNVSS